MSQHKVTPRERFDAAVQLQYDSVPVLDACDDLQLFNTIFNNVRDELYLASDALIESGVPYSEFSEIRAAAYRVLRDCEHREFARRRQREARDAISEFLRDAPGLMAAAIQAAQEC